MTLALSKYEELEKDDTIERMGLFDRVMGMLKPVINKIYQNAFYNSNDGVMKRACELTEEYEAYIKMDRNYRIKSKKTKKIRDLINNIPDEQEQRKEQYWQEYDELMKDIVDYYIQPVDVYDFADELMIHDVAAERVRREEELKAAADIRNKERDDKVALNDKELADKLAEIDMWSSNNVKTWFSRIGTLFGTFSISDAVLENVNEVDVYGYKIQDMRSIAIGIAAFTLPVVDYYLTKKKSAKTKEYAGKNRKETAQAEADMAAKRTEMSSQFKEAFEKDNERRKDIYEECFGTLEGFPESPVEAEDRRKKKLGIGPRTPLIAVKAADPEDIKRTAAKMKEKADNILG